MTIFKSYDVRGVYPSELDEDVVEKIGKAYIQFTHATKIVVGRDMRTSSPALFDALVRGVVSMGCDVVDIGMCSTPMFYFAIAKYGFDGGIMITASHNPGKYNGLKMCRAGAVPIGHNTGLMNIKTLTESELFSPGGGSVEKKDIFDDYAAHVLSFVDVSKIKGKKIVVDCGNGMAGVSELKVLQKLDCEIFVLFEEPDGNFPHHEANPIKEENVADLKIKMKEVGADIGIAFDGDCDRVVFVDEELQTVDGAVTGALVAERLLKGNNGAKILYTVIMSKIFPEIVNGAGGVPVLSRVGHAWIKERMKKEDILFGSERSGHFYYKDNFYVDSSVITALIVLEMLCNSRGVFSASLEGLRKYATVPEINLSVDNQDGAIEKVKEYYQGDGGDITELDGLTVTFDDWWFNLRKSGTEPVLRFNIEADTKELLDEKVEEVTRVISS